jgi:hypothetical protein
MGVLTDFVVADRGDAQRVCQSRCPSRDFSGMDAKGLDGIKLGSLWTILTGVESGPAFKNDTLCSGGEDGPWVFEVPADLVQQIARLSSSQLSSAGSRWGETEEFLPKYDNWSAEEVQQMLQGLAVLCKRAVAQGQAVLMWMCL